MNGGSSLAEVSASSGTSNGRGDAIPAAVQRADMDIEPPLTIRRCESITCHLDGSLTEIDTPSVKSHTQRAAEPTAMEHSV